MQLSHSKITKAIYQAAEIEYDNKAKAYDRTIQATIVRAADPLTGEVRVKYQDTILSAYVTDLQKANDYIKGKNVYISIPNNDMSQIKTVIGLVEGNNKISFVENEENYTLLSDKWFDDISKDNFDKEKLGELLIEKINLLLKPVNIVNPKPAVLLLKIEKMSANIKYDPLKNKNYGIKITLKVNKILKEIEGEWQETSPSEEDEKIDFIFDMDDITGYPLKYSEQNQFTLFTLVTNNGYPITKVSSLDSESSIELIEKDLNLDDSWNFEGLNFYSAKINEPLTNEGLVLGIQASRNFFSEGNETDIVLKPILKSAGITQDLSDENIAQCYWYRYDGSTFEKYSSGELLIQEVKEKGKTDEEGIIDETISDEDAIKNYKDKLQKQKYDYKAGFGWECLNDTYIRSEDNIYEDSDGNSYIYIEKGYYPYSAVDYKIKKGDFGIVPKRTYKLIVIFNNQIISKEIDIYDKTCNYSVEVEIDNSNNITSKVLKNSRDISNNYISKIYLKTISGTRYLIGTTKNKNPFNCTDILKNYQGQFYIEVDCFIDDFFIITGRINHLISGMQESNLLFIENGEQVFLYENKKRGEPNSPILPTATYPSAVKQLKAKFVHLNGDGTNDDNSNSKITWFIPKDYDYIKTLIDVNVGKTDFKEEIIEGISFNKNQWIKYVNPTLDFNIKSFYDENAPLGTYCHNDIYAYLEDGNNPQLLARTNFSFVIEGDPGTNGTGVYCRIVPNYEEGTFLPPYTMYTKKNSNIKINYSLNQKPNNNVLTGVPHFRTQLWKNNEKIFDAAEAEGKVASITWGWLKDNYGTKELYTIDSKNGVLYPKNYIMKDDAKDDAKDLSQWIKVSLSYENIIYENYYPIVYRQQGSNINSDNKKYIPLTSNTISPIFGLIANEGGELPRNKNQQYKILSSININNRILNLSNSSYKYFSFTNVDNNKADLNLYQLWLLNSYNDKVIYKYNEYTDSSWEKLYYPIGLFKRSSSGDFIQGWTKPYFVDEKNGQVFAKAYIGGEKNNNKLTGIIAGSYQEQNGYAAYKNGNKIFMVDAEESTMSIGESAAAQVTIVSTDEGGIIKSPLFDSNIDEESGLQGSGLKINLSKPSIEYKNKNAFSLNENGEGYLSNWIINNNFLSNENNYNIISIGGSDNVNLFTKPSICPWDDTNVLENSQKMLETKIKQNNNFIKTSFLTNRGDLVLKSIYISPINGSVESYQKVGEDKTLAIGPLKFSDSNYFDNYDEIKSIKNTSKDYNISSLYSKERDNIIFSLNENGILYQNENKKNDEDYYECVALSRDDGLNIKQLTSTKNKYYSLSLNPTKKIDFSTYDVKNGALESTLIIQDNNNKKFLRMNKQNTTTLELNSDGTIRGKLFEIFGSTNRVKINNTGIESSNFIFKSKEISNSIIDINSNGLVLKGTNYIKFSNGAVIKNILDGNNAKLKLSFSQDLENPYFLSENQLVFSLEKQGGKGVTHFYTDKLYVSKGINAAAWQTGTDGPFSVVTNVSLQKDEETGDYSISVSTRPLHFINGFFIAEQAE